MRVAAIVVTMLVVAPPAAASASCMSKTEARRQFPTVHIYWHGSDHCWDAKVAQRHQIRHVERAAPVHEVERKSDEPKVDQSKWRNSMSEMLPSDEPAQPRATSQQVQADSNDEAAGTFWADRWVDIAGFPFVARWVDIPQVTRPPSSDDGGAQPSAAPRSVVLMCIAFVLMIGTIEMLFGGTIFAGRSDGHY
jgi:hypothetical protein